MMMMMIIIIIIITIIMMIIIIIIIMFAVVGTQLTMWNVSHTTCQTDLWACLFQLSEILIDEAYLKMKVM
jgi:hypothetical protein